MLCIQGFRVVDIFRLDCLNHEHIQSILKVLKTFRPTFDVPLRSAHVDTKLLNDIYRQPPLTTVSSRQAALGGARGTLARLIPEQRSLEAYRFLVERSRLQQETKRSDRHGSRSESDSAIDQCATTRRSETGSYSNLVLNPWEQHICVLTVNPPK